MPNAQRHVSHGLLGEEAGRRMASARGDFNWSERGQARPAASHGVCSFSKRRIYAQAGRPVPKAHTPFPLARAFFM
jgi:hypothetical protein